MRVESTMKDKFWKRRREEKLAEGDFDLPSRSYLCQSFDSLGDAGHKPVMLQEVMQVIRPRSGLKVADFTFGRGGHAKEMLRNGAQVWALDRDLDAVRYGQKLVCENFRIFHSLFSEARYNLEADQYFDCALFDFGLSSTQIDCEEKGISFKKDSPLRMTMGKNKLDAYQVVNFFGERELADIIYIYGEERASRKIARKVVEMRKIAPIATTLQLAELVKKTIGFHGGRDPATKTFQAIRMYVNDELEEIRAGLQNAKMLLKTGGLMVAISFHSMEDRIVKEFFKQFKYRSKAIAPSEAEILWNPRSRSAKLRFACVT